MIMRKLLLVLMLLVIPPLIYASDAFFDKMSTLYAKREFVRIDKECRNELQKDRKSLDAYYFLTAIRLYQAKYDEAAPYMQQFEKYHREQEKRETAKTKVNSILIDARYTGLYREIGRQHFLNKEYAEAVNWLLKAKSAYYDDPMLNFFLGISYKEMKEYDEALKYLKRQLENQPDEPSPYYNIACIYANQGKTSEALQWLKKAIAAHPDFRQEAQKDRDFDKIRNAKEFIELVNNQGGTP